MRALALFLPACAVALAENAASPMPVTKFQALDAHGYPLAGGLVYACAAGSRCPGTPQDTYTDSTGTVKNQNPVVLDGDGQANIWLGPNPYKIVVQTAAGVTISSTDNVQTVNAGALAGVTGNLTAGGALAATSLATARGTLIDVTAFGAVHDNATDDTGHIQAAIDWAQANGGGVVYLPCGTYLLASNSGIAISSPLVSLRGSNENCVVLHYTGNGHAVTIQMSPFVSTPAGDYSDFTVLGTRAGRDGLYTGQIVSGSFRNIAVSGFTGAGAAGVHLHDAGNNTTWTERNEFLNVSSGGITGANVNTIGFLLDADARGDSFGYNRFTDITMNVSTGGTGFYLASGYFYNSSLTATCNADNNVAGSVGPICFRSACDWDANQVQLGGEYESSGTGTGQAYRLQVDSGGRFANLSGSALTVYQAGDTQLPDNIAPGASASPNITLVENSAYTSWDTGSYSLDSTKTRPQPIQRANYGSLGLLIGNNIESPYVSMYEATGNKFMIGTVASHKSIGAMTDVADFSIYGDFASPTYTTFCNAFYQQVCDAPATLIDGAAPVKLGGFTSLHRAGLNALYMQSHNGINEQISGDPNYSSGQGTVLGSNVAHPILWGYTLDPTDVAVYEKNFQTPLAAHNLVFQIAHGGALGQGATARNIAGTCTISGSTACSWRFTNEKASTPICVGSPAFNTDSTPWWITSTTTGCTVTTGAPVTGQFNFIVVGDPN